MTLSCNLLSVVHSFSVVNCKLWTVCFCSMFLTPSYWASAPACCMKTKLACSSPLTYRPCGLMDKASDFESEDCRFESCHGRIIFLVEFKFFDCLYFRLSFRVLIEFIFFYFLSEVCFFRFFLNWFPRFFPSDFLPSKYFFCNIVKCSRLIRTKITLTPAHH